MTQRKKKPKDYADHLDTLTKRLNKRLKNGKIKSTLVKSGKNIPGFGYWFKK